MESQTFGEKIKMLRLAQNLSLEKLAFLIDYNASCLSKIEKNQKKAPAEIIPLLSKTLKVSSEELMLKYFSENIYYELKNNPLAEKVLEIVQKRLKKEGSGTQYLKEKNEIINNIQSYFKTKKIEKAWIFGSFARNANISFDSDIDILVEFEKPNKLTLFDIIEIKNELAQKTGRIIDLVENGTELESLSAIIQKEKILIYEKQTNRFGASSAHD